MNINAVDKASQKSTKITITNDKGRLSKDEIDRLVRESERFKAEDDVVRAKIESKNSLEQTAYQIRNTLKDEKFKDKFKADEKQNLERLIDET